MIPLRDNVPSVHPSIALWLLIIVNAVLFIVHQTMPRVEMVSLFHNWGVVPARYFHPDWAAWIGYEKTGPFPFFTYMFLHSGWLHIIFNMWMLWIFADNIEDVTGPWRFLAFYFACGLVALVLQMVLEVDSQMPIIGASGAIAGIMGGYFVLYPHGRVDTFIFVIVLRLPAVFYLGVWFLVQFVSGLVDTSNGGGADEVAWWAHVGGFVAGALLINLFRIKGRCYYCYNANRKRYDRDPKSLPVGDQASQFKRDEQDHM